MTAKKKNVTSNATPKKAAKAPKSAKTAKHAANAATTANTANDATTNKPAKKVAKTATTGTAPTNTANDATTANEPPMDTTNTANAEPAEPATQKLVTPVTSEPPANRLSALDAAALVLAKSPKALTTQELIGVMAVRKLWFSPGGKTPAATLYSAITREIATKGSASRFTKAAPGRFAANTANANTTANNDNTNNDDGDDSDSTAAHAEPAEADDTPFSESDVYRL